MLAAFMIGAGFTGVVLPVTPIGNEFSADITTTQWALNIFALTYGVFMVTGGRLDDTYGHRRLILVGAVVDLGACAQIDDKKPQAMLG
jgi:MFS family permease